METGEGITWKWILRPAEWDRVIYYGGPKGVMAVVKNRKYGFIDINGNILSPPQWDIIRSVSDGMVQVMRGGTYEGSNAQIGFLDISTGNIVGLGQWDWATDFHEGMAAVSQSDKWAYMDKTGKIVSPPQWSREIGGASFVRDYSEGLVAVSKDGKCGYLDKTGKIVIPLQWDSAGDFKEGMAAVSKGGKVGFIDKNGKVIIQPQYDGVNNFSEGMAAVAKNGKWGYIDKTGKVVVPLQWKEAGDFKDGTAVVGNSGDTGMDLALIDRSGKQIVANMQVIDDFYDGIARFTVIDKNYNTTSGYMDKKGKVLLTSKGYMHESVDYFKEGMARAKVNNKWVYVDTSGKIAIDGQWDKFMRFESGFARIVKDDKWGFIDKAGNIISQPQWDFVWYFVNGYARVAVGNLSFETHPMYLSIDGHSYMNAYGGKWSLINTSGKLLFPLQWSWIGNVQDGYVAVGEDNKSGLIQIISPPKGNVHYPTPLEKSRAQ